MSLASLGPIDENELNAFDKSDDSDVEIPFRFISLTDNGNNGVGSRVTICLQLKLCKFRSSYHLSVRPFTLVDKIDILT